jgi:hypothetical protein
MTFPMASTAAVAALPPTATAAPDASIPIDEPEGALAGVFDDPGRAECVLRQFEQRHGVRGEVMRPRPGRMLAAPARAVWSLVQALRGLWGVAGARSRLRQRWLLQHLAARRRAQGKSVLVLHSLDARQQAELVPLMALSARSWAQLG